MPHSWVEISKSALRHNATEIRSLLDPSVKLMVAVKANAYGHGLVQTAQSIDDLVDGLAVVNLDEARQLREAGINNTILVLGYYEETEEALDWASQERIELPVTSLEQAKKIVGRLNKNTLRVHIKVDTGMGRSGILYSDAAETIKRIAELPGLNIRGVFSHLPDIVDHEAYTRRQLSLFSDIKFQLYRDKIDPPLWHIAKTSAILTLPESHHNAVRLGIGLYGLWSDDRLPNRVAKIHPDFTLRPALSWKARVVQVKDYPKDHHIGYGCTYTTKRETRVAVIASGYYEGMDRRMSNNGNVLIRGNRCPIVGRICMNMTMIDVSGVDHAREGDEATIIGVDGADEITVDEIAESISTINYEVITRINPRLERIIIH